MEQESPRFSNPRNASANAPTPPSIKRNSTHGGVQNRQFFLKKSDLVSGYSSSGGLVDGNGNRLLLQRSNLVSGFSSSGGAVQDYKNFKKSGAPSRILLFRDGSWDDVPRQVFDVLRAGFLAGKTTLEVPLEGNPCVFDFLRMSRVDMGTGALNSIAWIDIGGRCFFPRMAVEEQRSRPPKLDAEVSDCSISQKRKRDSLDYPEEHSDESPAAAADAAVEDRARWLGTELLETEDKHYKIVENLFVAGVQRAGFDAAVTSIHRCSHSGPVGNSRWKAFQTRIQMTKAARGGDANVKFGWYGTSAEGVAGVAAHGFGLPDNRRMGSDACGVGVHLSPPNSPYASSLLTEADGDGERHLVLCRVIMGKSEEVPAGSHQFHPSSHEFDSGVDKLANPRWYVVWATHMNTHILPEYVVSYRMGKPSQGSRGVTAQARRSSVTSLSFSKLFAEMGRYLPSSRMQAVEIFYNQYKAGKINRQTFIRYLRSITGDKIITSIIRRVRGF